MDVDIGAASIGCGCRRHHPRELLSHVCQQHSALWLATPGCNASYLIQWTLCGVGMYALAWNVTRSALGAWLAGLAYQSMPHLMGQAYNGISETMMAGFLPLALLAMRALFHGPTHGRAIIAGITVRRGY